MPAKGQESAPAVTPPAPSAPTSLLDQPAQPAKVVLTDGLLSVEAQNSSLTQILDCVAKQSGMTISGLSKDERIFGVYGPGSPSEVLSELLDGAGYNVLMAGDTTAGAPRELVLTVRQSGAAVPPPQTQVQANQDSAEPSASPPEQPVPENPNEPLRTPAQVYQRMLMMHRMQDQQPPQ